MFLTKLCLWVNRNLMPVALPMSARKFLLVSNNNAKNICINYWFLAAMLYNLHRSTIFQLTQNNTK